MLIVASPERIAGLEATKRDLQRLADPRGLAPAEADAILARAPVVTWLMHAVHGDEISSSDAALMEAYHLLAARGDAAVDAILRESIVIIDPLQNPDGRARFVSTNLQGEAATPDAEPYAVERDQPWPGGRYNHYLFDMNRDWFAQTQPETRGRAALYREFWPHVVVDLHEMGGESSYYFAPPADPINPLITKNQQKWFDAFGRANGAMFDARGFAYFIREVYDSFYPGYGESWPIFQGAIGMTYEQASARGLRYRREDGAVLSYRDGVLHHFTAAITTAETAAKNRAAILRDFYDYRRSAVSEGETGPVREYLLVPGADPSRAERLARLLATQGIEVSRAVEPFRLGTRTLPAGTWVVPAAQPSGRLRAQPARSRDPAARGVHQGAGPPPREEARRSDLRRHGVEPAARLRRRGRDRGSPDAGQGDADGAVPRRGRGDGAGGGQRARRRAAQGRVPRALGIGDGEPGRGGAAPGDPPALGGPAVHARRPRLRRRHRAGADRRERRDDAGGARRAGAHARRRAGAHRHRVRRQRDVARQRIDGRAQGAARGDGVGHRHAADVRRLDALHARAPLRPAGDGGARRLARPRRLHARRRAGAAVGHLHRRSPATACAASRTGSTPAAR